MGFFDVLGGIFGGLGVGVQMYGQYKAGKANELAAEAKNRANAYNADIYDANAKLLYEKSEGVISEGVKAEEKFRRQTEGIKGSQRAGFGVSGAVVDEGSALDVLKDTAMLGEEDALTIRENAYRDYETMREQASNQEKQAELIRMGGEVTTPSSALPMASTFLTGASNLAARYGRANNGNKI